VTLGNPVRRLFVPPQGKRLEYFARVATVGLILGVAVAFAVGALGRFGSTGHAIELVARQPAAGGWSRDRIVVNQGERVRLRIRSEDVVHGFAIGRIGVEAGPIEPGKVTVVDFVADRAGEFTFYCTVWCDPNHARMRGILEVRGQAVTETARPYSASDILLQHLDDPRDAGIVPAALPSATRGRPLYEQRCASCHGERAEGTPRASGVGRREVLMDRRPVEVFRLLAGKEAHDGASPAGAHGSPVPHGTGNASSHRSYVRDWSAQERWDVVAALWSFSTTAERLDLGQRLFLRNCAACHGERGAGDGPGGKHQPKKPADFTDARRMLAGTSGLYTAKIRRGGMGTGMPYWGSIFTEEELAAVVDRVWDFSLGIAE
jgi:mono/diheme cytochrome c family protein/F0F1-type ATP synthase membrane subunit c/vacuolar-type H+-ATPase subunit K